VSHGRLEHGVLALVATVVGLLAGFAGFPDAPPARAAEAGGAVRILKVRGHAVVAAAPDSAVVRLGIQTRAQTAQQALRRASEVVEAVLRVTDWMDIDEREVQTRSVELVPLWRDVDKGRQLELAGYEARYELEVTVHPPERVGLLVDEAVKAGANRLHGIRFGLRNLQAVQQQALQQAIADALRQARTLAEAAGVRLGPVISVDEVQLSTPAAPPAPMALASGQEAAPPIAAGELAVEAWATVTFELL